MTNGLLRLQDPLQAFTIMSTKANSMHEAGLSGTHEPPSFVI